MQDGKAKYKKYNICFSNLIYTVLLITMTRYLPTNLQYRKKIIKEKRAKHDNKRAPKMLC